MQHEITLELLRRAPHLRWKSYTVFEAGKGVDGNLYASDHHVSAADLGDISPRFPLDVWTETERVGFPELTLPYTNGVGVVFDEPQTWTDIEAAVIRWCSVVLGRKDVTVEPQDIDESHTDGLSIWVVEKPQEDEE
jgi:hypothetical protein